MKIVIPLFAIIFLFASCQKEIPEDPISDSGPPYPSVIDTQEYFWGIRWTNISGNTYKHTIYTPRLTDSVISRGISVKLAVYSDWDPFEQVPFIYSNAGLADSVRFNYTVIPGKLELTAQTALTLDWPSDVMIRY